MSKTGIEMRHKSPAILYKAHQRGHTENDHHRLLATLNFENYRAESREPFGCLTTLNDEVLAPGQAVNRQTVTGFATLIIPLIGGLEIEAGATMNEIFPDEALLISEHNIAIKNPYEADLVNFLYIEFTFPYNTSQTYSLNFTSRNTLNLFIEATDFKGITGIFDGRAETVYTPQPGNGLFAFVISGAFEIEGRLLEERDAIALWDITRAELEALSENAVILLFEVVYP